MILSRVLPAKGNERFGLGICMWTQFSTCARYGYNCFHECNALSLENVKIVKFSLSGRYVSNFLSARSGYFFAAVAITSSLTALLAFR